MASNMINATNVGGKKIQETKRKRITMKLFGYAKNADCAII